MYVDDCCERFPAAQLSRAIEPAVNNAAFCLLVKGSFSEEIALKAIDRRIHLLRINLVSDFTSQKLAFCRISPHQRVSI